MAQLSQPRPYYVVVRSHPPYYHDLYHIFALPQGFKFRHRYRGPWTTDSLARDPSDLVGRDMLVFFEDLDAQHVVPVRWGRIDNVLQFHDIVYIDYTLLEMASATDASKRGFPVHSDQFQGRPNKDSCLFLGPSTQPLGRSDFSDFDNWYATLQSVAQSKVFSDYEFLKILDLSEVKETSHVSLQTRWADSPLRRGRAYRLRVFQAYPNLPKGTSPPVSAHDIELRTLPEIKVLTRHQKAVGRYDVLEWVLRPSPRWVSGTTEAHIVSLAPGGAERPDVTNLSIPLSIAARSGAEIGARSVIALLTLVLIFAHLPLPSQVGQALPDVGLVALMIQLIDWAVPGSIHRLFLGQYPEPD